MSEDGPDARWRWLSSPWLLAAVVVLVYAPSLSGGWLGFDDDWLARDNELLNGRSLGVLGAIMGGFDRDTRLVLGAEYLPVRDLVTWLARAWLGLDAFGLRVLMLGLYAGASALFVAWARTLGRDGRGPDGYVIGAWIFALHPVHAESVAWIAGLKDVLALAGLGGALFLAAERTPLRRVGVVVCVFLACGAKSVAIVAPALLLSAELLRARALDRPVLAASTAVCVAWAAVHVWVGGVVGMIAAPLGDSTLERLGSALVLFTRYVGLSSLVHPQSVVYEADVHGLDLPALASLALVVVLGALAAWQWRLGHRWPAALVLWFVASLAPVSQIVAPLQNRLADRYLLVALWAPCAALGVALELAARRTRPPLGAVIVVASFGTLGLLSGARGLLFADPVALFAEASERTTSDPRPPLLLGDALFAREQYADAEIAYRAAIDRDRFQTVSGRRAGNRLALLLAGSTREEEAMSLYALLVERYPDDPRALHNLAVLEERTGQGERAAQHRAELASRFPAYRPGAERPGPL
jgi:tetratricopeptide (TPR) repeat protein